MLVSTVPVRIPVRNIAVLTGMSPLRSGSMLDFILHYHLQHPQLSFISIASFPLMPFVQHSLLSSKSLSRIALWLTVTSRVPFISLSSASFIPVAHCERKFAFAATSMTFSTTSVGVSTDGGTEQQVTTNQSPLVSLSLPQPLILGSGSFTRKLILKEMGIVFNVMARPIDEKNLGDRTGNPKDLVLQLAKAKADYLVEGILNGEVDSKVECGRMVSEILKTNGYYGLLVLTGDQVVTHEGDILEKPETIEEARSFIERYARSPPSTVGACVITHIPSMAQVKGVDSAQINFKPTVATSNLIDQLLEDDAPILSCAGGLMIEHPFVKEHIDSIEGTIDSVMGLSKDLVMSLLSEMKKRLDSL